MSDCPDYDEIKRMSAALGRTTVDLVALTKQRDPFFIMPFRLAQARWFAEVWRVLSPTGDVHLRRLHYRYVSQPARERPPKLNGEPYENTDRDWDTFCNASQDARALGLVDASRFIDRRAGEPIYLADDGRGEDSEADRFISGVELESPPAESAFAFAYAPEVYEFPPLPEVYISAPVLEEPYALEIWVEKSTMNDILAPLARSRNVTLIAGVGELSYTHCQRHVARVLEHGKPTRILYISDFDPAGSRMPISVARKIEFLLRRDGHDLDIRLDPLVLTREQVGRFGLPRIPIKDSDRGKARFEEQHGEGAVELDALEAMRPGELRRLVAAAIDRYREPTREAERENRAVAAAAQEEAREERAEVLAKFGSEIEALRQAFDEMQTAIEADQDALAAIAELAAERSRAHVDAINARVAAFYERAADLWAKIGAELEDRVPDADGFDWVEPEEADEGDALFDSARDYLDQIDAYKVHGGAE